MHTHACNVPIKPAGTVTPVRLHLFRGTDSAHARSLKYVPFFMLMMRNVVPFRTQLQCCGWGSGRSCRCPDRLGGNQSSTDPSGHLLSSARRSHSLRANWMKRAHSASHCGREH